MLNRKFKINLALQGGGAHGAFTWGVIDRLLEEERLSIRWVSGTSAGAVNAVALASGFATGGRKEARKILDAVWHAVYNAGVPDFVRFNPFLYSLSKSPALAQVASLWSPYDFNPLGFDPLRQLLSKTIDFDALRRSSQIELLIAATEVSTGQARLFTRQELTIDSVLASACLPTLHHAVTIDGNAYWDGGFSANPDLVNLALQSPVQDTLLVKITPLTQEGLPTGVSQIADHANRITFNAPLLRDLRIIEGVRESSRWWFGRPMGRYAALAKHRFHLIDAGRYTAALGPQTKVKPDWQVFQHLKQSGRSEASKWLDLELKKVGRRSTVNLSERFLRFDASRPVQESVSEPARAS